jgi:acetyltransferase-like isoleucine patch superfamily enzyme
MKKAFQKFEEFYVNHFLRPHFESIGKSFFIVKPWHVEVFGSPIVIGDYANVIASTHRKVNFSVWSDKEDRKGIKIGNYCLICPGVRMASASEISVGDNCMIASGVYITDSDWHDIYNRISPGTATPVRIEPNVWVGDSAIICKGITIGENSIVGTGAVVTSSVPPNTIAAGNPARVVKHLDPKVKIATRAHWFSDPVGLFKVIDQAERDILQGNTILHWLRYLLFPAKGD